jgi:hypothetical protein
VTIRNTIAAIAIAAASFNAFAEDAEEICAGIGEVAASIMYARQTGRPMKDMIEMANDAKKEAGKEAGKVIMDIVRAAYSEPKMSYEPNQMEASIEFGNQVTVRCLQDN